MTSTKVPVTAQWALEGKQPDGEGYRILACSSGDLNRANFADALSRFQLGELSTLPQVSVSYARHGTQQGLSYLALAIHWHAREGECFAEGVSPRDNQGRLTAYTSYFCLPYHRLAEAAIGYVDMYETLSAVMLTVADGPPKEVPIALPTSRIPAADDLAVRVAPLLLTGQPVCVLGAEGTSMRERLEFIDTVMGLLPYGFRSRMTAATWTRATNRNHRFRLFFSSAPRADEPDHVVTWGDDPDLMRVPGGDAGDYFDWLQDNIGPLARLAELTNEFGFGPKDTLQAVESVVGTRHRFRFRSRPAASNGKPWPPPAPPAPVQSDPGEEALVACAELAQLPNPPRLRSEINFLKKFSAGEISEDARRRYQDLVGGLGLLQHELPVDDKYKERFYGALLRLAFGIPLSYAAYCKLETHAGLARGAAPRRDLLEAIGNSNPDGPVLSAIVHWHLGQTDEKALNKWLISGQVDPISLIGCLARDWSYAPHARIVCDVTLSYLKKVPRGYDSRKVQLALHEHGFLARALQTRHPDKDEYQVYALYHFLKAAYPQPATTPGQDLSKTAIQRILNGTDSPPTPALFSAVLMLLERPESWQLAWNAYIHGSVTRPKFDHLVRAHLSNRLPALDPAALDPAALDPAALDPAALDPAALDPAAIGGQEPLQEEDPARPGEDMIGRVRSEPTR
jgi:hypothetical protein